MRVGVRRLRACFAMFGRIVPASTLAPVRAELQWLGMRLGRARDWDVFVDEMLPQIARNLDQAAAGDALAALDRAAGARRERARRSARSALRSHRSSRLLLELGGIAVGGGTLFAGEEMREPATSFTPTLLQRRFERVLKKDASSRRQSATALHALRIAVKKLRYGVEFFGEMYPLEAVQAFRAPLLKLQDCLGTINDAYAMRARVRTCVPGDARLAQLVLGCSAQVIAQERARLRKLWRRFRRARPFW
jgi:CHAD domain-containing protein